MSPSSVAPTVKTSGAEAGEKLTASELLLPAATARKTPLATRAAAASLTASDRPPPSDRFATLPPAHSSRSVWSLAT